MAMVSRNKAVKFLRLTGSKGKCPGVRLGGTSFTPHDESVRNFINWIRCGSCSGSPLAGRVKTKLSISFAQWRRYTRARQVK